MNDIGIGLINKGLATEKRMNSFKETWSGKKQTDSFVELSYGRKPQGNTKHPTKTNGCCRYFSSTG